MESITFTRWHRFDHYGNKQIKKFPLDFVPGCADLGYTVWSRGMGRCEGPSLERLTAANKRNFLGKPKPESQRIKMREAKIGIPKSLEHRAAMAEAQKARRAREQEQSHANT